MSITTLNKLRVIIDEIVPYSLLEWFQTNYATWLLSRTFFSLFFVPLFQHCASFGEKNQNLTYYIVDRDSWAGNGLFSCVNAIVSAIEYAVERGYIPVVDMKNGDNAYLYPDEIGKINAWEYYFEQPLENINQTISSLEEAYRSKNVIINNMHHGGIVQALYPAGYPSLLDAGSHNRIMRRRSIQYKKYVRLNKNTEKYIDEQYKKIIHDGDRVLGICVRGGEYRFSRPFGHPIQPEIDDIISQVHSSMKSWNCNKIFLTTEDIDILQIFTQEFGDAVISTDRSYIKYVICDSDEGRYLKHVRPHERENEKYLQGLEYLTDIVILSRCNSIIGGTSCGMIAAVLMSNGFEHQYFFDCGVFGITDKRICGTFSSTKGTWVIK